MKIGADPELFVVTREGRLVEGQEALKGQRSVSPQITPDGVQVEIHPDPSNCAALFGGRIRSLLMQLKTKLAREDLTILNDTTISVPAKDLRKMSEEAQKLGCAPSSNIYNPHATVNVGARYTGRSCGGHLHFSSVPPSAGPVKECVKRLDYVLGNFSVMVDPDPQAAKRRRVYGRAGEYRVKPYGFEYRTLSNFWLRSFPLTSMVFQVARDALSMEPRLWEQMSEAVPAHAIARAINKADRDAAWANFQALVPFLTRIGPAQDAVFNTGKVIGSFPLGAIPDITYFLSKPLSYWFHADILEEWGSYGHCDPDAWRAISHEEATTTAGTYNYYRHYCDPFHYGGWHSFLLLDVRPKRLAAEAHMSSDNKKE